MKYFILLSCILLTACGTTKPIISVQPQEVFVPVAVACKAVVPSKPDFNFDKATVDQNIFDKIKALLADRKLHLGYETELLAALTSCIK
jgi:uncharacterized lipoprotein YajG